jgi:hypothetical protein
MFPHNPSSIVESLPVKEFMSNLLLADIRILEIARLVR